VDSVEPMAPGTQMDPSLVALAPRALSSRAVALREALVGSTIRVVVDQRQGERRGANQPTTLERRHGDRRAPTRIVAYVYGCPVVAVGLPPAPTLRERSSGCSPGLEGAGIRSHGREAPHSEQLTGYTGNHSALFEGLT
jgi:hypothetical protein